MARILLIDDDANVTALLRSRLEGTGRYEVTVVNRPKEAVAMAVASAPVLIVCDIDMPGMDGGDVSAALFADDETRDIPVLFLSQLLSGEREVGGRHAIAKSAPLAELQARIEALLKA